jgi:CheY-like chemotaxis protein
VLVAEDDPTSLRMAAAMFRTLGCEVLTATDGADAVAMLTAGEAVDLVLMDLQMPNMGGIEATRALRRAGVHNPIVGATAGTPHASDEAWHRAGMTACIRKPYTPGDLGQVLALHVPHWTPGSAAPPPAVRTDAVGDRDLCARAAALGFGEDEFRDLIRFFSEDTRRKLELSLNGLRKSDLERVRNLGHGLRGAALNLYLPAAARLAGNLEYAAAAGDLDKVETAVELLLQEVKALQSRYTSRASEWRQRPDLLRTEFDHLCEDDCRRLRDDLHRVRGHTDLRVLTRVIEELGQLREAGFLASRPQWQSALAEAQRRAQNVDLEALAQILAMFAGVVDGDSGP